MGTIALTNAAISKRKQAEFGHSFKNPAAITANIFRPAPQQALAFA